MILERGISILPHGEQKRFKSEKYHLDIWTHYRKIIVEPRKRYGSDGRYAIYIFCNAEVWESIEKNIYKIVENNLSMKDIKDFLIDNHIELLRTKIFHDDLYEFWYSDGNESVIRDTYSSITERKYVEGRTW